MGRKQPLLAIMAMPLLCANQVAASTDELLFTQSDLVAIGRVVSIGVLPPLATPNDVRSGDIVVKSFATTPCVKIAVEHRQKGIAGREIIVCRARVSELNPKPLKLRQRYKLFLRRDGMVYVPTSWDAFKDLSPA